MIYTYTPKRLIAGSALTSSLATYYTSGATYGAILNELELINTDTVERLVSVYIIPASGTAGVASKIFAETLQPGQRWRDERSSVIPVGFFIQAIAAAGAVVTINASGVEIS